MITILTLNTHRQIHLADVIKPKTIINQPNKRPKCRRGIIIFRLAQQQSRAPFKITQIHIIAKRRANYFASRANHQNHFWFRVIPCRFRVNANFKTCTDARHGRCFGKHFGIRANAHFQILTPHILLNQHLLHPLSFIAAGGNFGQIRTNFFIDHRTDFISHFRVAHGFFFNHPL